jgi:hypothetical protein
MTDTQRIENLEKRVNALFDIVNRNNFYTGADIAGTRQSVSEITPYKETKTAYIDDTEITFDNVPTGNLSVFSTVSEYDVNRDGETVIIDFAPLEEVTEFTIMVQ